ncbi:MAG TPA: ABC transporter permease [Blastocatellia bacterium]|nr:ABC transporter permease [Blastocatellia bacterium]
MTGSRKTTRFRFWLWLIALIGVIVPRRLRADWRQEWEAELRYREQLLEEWDNLNWRNKLDLLRRSLGAFRDAMLLQPKRLEDEMFQDLRYGVRMLLKVPGFTLIAVFTLSLGIGANTAIFTLLDKVLIRTLPVEQPHQLVAIVKDGGGTPVSFSYPMYAELRDRNEVLSGLAAYFQQPFSMSDGKETERLIGQIVSGNYFATLGVRPALGRFFLPEEDRTPGTRPVAVISHGLWRRRFGADPAAIGRIVSLNGRPFTVVGVAPAEFTGTARGTVNDVYVPAMMQTEAQPGRNSKLNDRGSGWLRLIGRLKPNASRQQAQTALTTLAEEAKKTFPGSTDPANVFLMDGSHGYTDRVKDLSPRLKLLMGVVGFVLAVACANVANLLLARASARRKEIAVRLAIGAGRFRIVRQLLTECMILTALGAGGGLLIAVWLTNLLLGFQQQSNFIPLTFDGGLDGRVLGFTLCLSLLTGIVFGLAPALQASKPDFVSALKEDAPGIGAGARRWNLRNPLVVAQVALSFVVLIGAGLCVKNLHGLQAIDPGFEPAKVMTASFDLSLNGYDETRGQQFFARLSERVEALPGVEAFSFARGVALSGFVWIRSATIEGYQPQPNERLAFNFNVIGPNYFKTLGTPLAQGREFTARDAAGAPRVVIVNEATARRYWPGQEAVGKRLKYGNVDQFAEVVGVVRNSKEKGLTEDPRPAIYAPLLQNYAPDLTLHVRTATESQATLAALRREAQSLDSQLPVYNLRTLAEQKDGALYEERVATALLTLFGLLALSLSAVGIYGVMSYAVSQRKREIGIRLALGARPRDALKLVIRQGMILTLIGLMIGLAAAVALTRLMATFMTKLLVSVSATDTLTFVVISILLTAAALLACWIPARRAAKVDPIVALRHD